MSRNTAYLLLYLIPVMVTAVGLCGALCVTRGCKRIQRWPALCSLMCLYLLIPPVFWIGGGVFFPMAIMYSDTCASLENVGWELSEGSADYLCTEVLGGTWHGAGVCEFDISDLATKTGALRLLCVVWGGRDKFCAYVCAGVPCSVVAVSVNLQHAARALLEDCSVYRKCPGV